MATNYEVTTTNLAASLTLPTAVEAAIVKALAGVTAAKIQTASAVSEISSGTNIAEVSASGTIAVSNLPATLEALVIKNAAATNLTLSDPAFDGVIVINNSAANTITATTGKNLTIQAGDGADTVVTAGGADSITTGAGNDSVATGAGKDSVVVSASATDRDTVDTGSGVDRIVIEGNLSASQLGSGVTAAKSGDTVVIGLPSGQTVTVKNGEIIAFADNTAIAVVNSKSEAAIMRLYKGFVGRDMDADGAAWWLGNLRDNPGKTTESIVAAFANEAETRSIMTAGTNGAFLDQLYQRAFGRAGDAAGKQYWLDQLAASGTSRVDVVAKFMWSVEAEATIVGVINMDGSQVI